MNKKGNALLGVLKLNPYVLLGLAIFVLLLIIIVGVWIRFFAGIALFVLGLVSLAKTKKGKKPNWEAYALLILGAILMLNPYGLIDNLSVVV